jgi:hypothetical protein
VVRVRVSGQGQGQWSGSVVRASGQGPGVRGQGSGSVVRVRVRVRVSGEGQGEGQGPAAPAVARSHRCSIRRGCGRDGRPRRGRPCSPGCRDRVDRSWTLCGSVVVACLGVRRELRRQLGALAAAVGGLVAVGKCRSSLACGPAAAAGSSGSQAERRRRTHRTRERTA